MIPLPRQDRSLTQQEIEQLIQRTTLASDDQFNQMLLLTVQAVLQLHMALDGKFIRTDAGEI